MPQSDTTCWTMIRDAAAGDAAARAEFVDRYELVVRATLAGRWKGSPLRDSVDDAVQEVFLACFKEQGALHRADPEHGRRFGAYLYGVVRNVARRFEERRVRAERQAGSDWLRRIVSREDSFSRRFERNWARTLVEQAMRLHAQRAEAVGEASLKRVELLRLRFRREMPIRDIARVWNADPAVLHREYARARREFAEALYAVVEEHLGGTPREVRAACARLAASLN